MSTHGDNPFAAFAFRASPSNSMSSPATSPSHPSSEYENPPQQSLPLQQEVERYEGDPRRTHQITETGRTVSKARGNPRSRGTVVFPAPLNCLPAGLTPKWSRAPRDTSSQEYGGRGESQGSASSSTFSSRLDPVKAATEDFNGGPCVIEITSSPEASCRERHTDGSGSDDGRQDEEWSTEKRAEEEADVVEERRWREQCGHHTPGDLDLSLHHEGCSRQSTDKKRSRAVLEGCRRDHGSGGSFSRRGHAQGKRTGDFSDQHSVRGEAGGERRTSRKEGKTGFSSTNGQPDFSPESIRAWFALDTAPIFVSSSPLMQPKADGQAPANWRYIVGRLLTLKEEYPDRAVVDEFHEFIVRLNRFKEPKFLAIVAAILSTRCRDSVALKAMDALMKGAIRHALSRGSIKGKGAGQASLSPRLAVSWSAGRSVGVTASSPNTECREEKSGTTCSRGSAGWSGGPATGSDNSERPTASLGRVDSTLAARKKGKDKSAASHQPGWADQTGTITVGTNVCNSHAGRTDGKGLKGEEEQDIRTGEAEAQGEFNTGVEKERWEKASVLEGDKDEMLDVDDMLRKKLELQGPTCAIIKDMSVTGIEELISCVNYKSTKARVINQLARMLHQSYGSRVPSTYSELTKLPGVGPVIANFLLTILYGRNEVPLPQTLEMKFLRLPRPNKGPRVEVAVEEHTWPGSAGVGRRCADAKEEIDVPGESRNACLESGLDSHRRRSRREVTLEPDTSAVQQLLANGGGLLVDSNMRRLSMVLGWITADEGRDLEKTKKALERWVPPGLYLELPLLMTAFAQLLCGPEHAKCSSCWRADVCPHRQEAMRRRKDEQDDSG
ncbi:helix-hairpin-helix motif domain-containing protein [Cystoisospora suis]|uniref:Helix-hairpin-helix motif domain-containing protein n=1 Tax=Cystoisospora suis TaxID=483139 RepID=A0A2C6KYG4_9APIC|nr:helix-hairpin-helix motif domain-containing protein [Cystoisospora suis]